jgi:glycosyltransferase involved in cell wall biosynthesis
MKVCMLAYSFYESDTRILQYASALARRGDTVDVIALRHEGKPAFEVLDGVRVFRIQPRSRSRENRAGYLFQVLRFMVHSAAILTRRQLSVRYDVIHVHSVPDFLVLAAIVPKLLGAGIILDIHDILPEFYASKFNLPSTSLTYRFLLIVERISVAFADHVIAANEIWRERLLSRSVRLGRCTAIRNYPDPTIFFPRSGATRNGKFLIIYPGTLNRHQGLDIAIRAFAQIVDLAPEAEFHIYGEGPERSSLIALRDALGLKDRVQIEGLLSLNEIAPRMASADVAVVPKRTSTGFGNEASSTKIMEFMALGVPVIVSRTRIDSYYHDDSMVQFVEPENENDLANAILFLRNTPARRHQLARNAFRYLLNNNWERKQFEYLSVVDTLVSSVTVKAERELHV